MSTDPLMMRVVGPVTALSMVLATGARKERRGIPFDNHNREALYLENCTLSSGPAPVSLERLLGAQAPHPQAPGTSC